MDRTHTVEYDPFIESQLASHAVNFRAARAISASAGAIASGIVTCASGAGIGVYGCVGLRDSGFGVGIRVSGFEFWSLKYEIRGSGVRGEGSRVRAES